MTSATRVIVSATAAGVRFDIRVIPRAPRTEVKQVREGRLLVRVTAPPVDQAANEAVAVALSRALDVPARSVRVVLGDTARNKTIEIAGMDPLAIQTRIDRLTGTP